MCVQYYITLHCPVNTCEFMMNNSSNITQNIFAHIWGSLRPIPPTQKCHENRFTSSRSSHQIRWSMVKAGFGGQNVVCERSLTISSRNAPACYSVQIQFRLITFRVSKSVLKTFSALALFVWTTQIISDKTPRRRGRRHRQAIQLWL